MTEALEHLMAEDAATARPFIAAIAISKARNGLPAPGFFDCARRLGRFAGDAAGLEACAFHAGVQRRGRVLGGNGNQGQERVIAARAYWLASCLISACAILHTITPNLSVASSA